MFYSTNKSLLAYAIATFICVNITACKFKSPNSEKETSFVKTEVDNYTERYTPRKDALEELNRMTREHLQKTLDRSNAANEQNVDNVIYNVYTGLSGGTCWSQLEIDVNNSTTIESCKLISNKDTVYKNISYFQAIALFLANMGSSFNVGRYMLGSDKLGHFLEEGYKYYNKAIVEGQGWSAAAEIGEYAESGIFGLTTTAVYSWGDLNSNFAGGHMYNELAPTQYNYNGKLDPNNTKVKTYIIKENDKWILNPERPYDWKEYLHAGMDEGINCSTYKNKEIYESVQEQLLLLEKNNPGKRYQCPAEPDLCVELAKYMNDKYPEFAHRLVSKRCMETAAKQIPEFKKYLEKYKFGDYYYESSSWW